MLKAIPLVGDGAGVVQKMEGILSFIEWEEEKGKVENLVTIEEDVCSIKIRHKQEGNTSVVR